MEDMRRQIQMIEVEEPEIEDAKPFLRATHHAQRRCLPRSQIKADTNGLSRPAVL
jgi:hypothetical protein